MMETEKEVLETYCNVITKTLIHDNNTHTYIQALPGLKILHMNIRSLKKNFDEFLILLDSLGRYEFDIIVLTEARVHINMLEYDIPNYKNIKMAGNKTVNEGVVLYYKSNLLAKKIELTLSDCNSLTLELKNPETRKIITIMGLYRSPSTRDPEEFINSLDKALTRFKIDVLVGDVNINLKDVNNPKVEHYLNTLNGKGFISGINDFTRIRDNTKTCIDHIFIHEKVYDKKMTGLVIQANTTDHFAQAINLPSINSPKQIEKKTKNTKIDYKSLKKSLKNENWEETFTKDDANQAYNAFLVNFKKHIKNNSHDIERTRNDAAKLKPWITNDLVAMMRHRDQLHERAKNNKDDLYFNKHVRNYRNHVKKQIRMCKEKYFKDKLEKANGDMKQTWNVINDLTFNIRKETEINQIVHNQTAIPTKGNETKVANIINDHFLKTGENLAGEIQNSEESVKKMIGKIHNVKKSIFFHSVKKSEIKKTIKQLKNSPCTGTDGIKIQTLKETAEEIATPLEYIINTSLATGVFPDELKKAIVTPLHKGGDEADVNNYRPISILNNISKIFEKIIDVRIRKFLKKKNILSSRQFGFTKGKSTQDAIDSLMSKINDAKENGEESLILLLDLKKAFETVSHRILEKKLKRIGIRGTAYNLIANYLNNRTQITKINNNSMSDEKPLSRFGLPTGTCLAPTLFLIFLNDLLNLKTNGQLASFADDTRLICSHSNAEKLFEIANHDFAKIRDWLRNNYLTLNIKKTNYIHIKKHQPSEHNKFKISDIDLVESAKYLGIIIDNKLKWDKHVNYLAGNLRKTIYKFILLRKILKIEQLNMVYHALVDSRISYGITAWGGTHKKYTEKISVIQRKILKIIHKLNPRTPTSQLEQISKVPNLRQIFITRAIILTQKHENKVKTHGHNTRLQRTRQLDQKFTRKEYFRNQADYVGKKFYNKLPGELKDIAKKPIFTKKLKSFILQEKNLFIE